MNRKLLLPYLSALLLSCLMCGATLAFAEDDVTRSTDAVTSILFDYNADEFATYVIHDDGSVDITFASNTPDALYSEILDKLLHNPDIKNVLAGKGGPACSLF